eukprot:Gb_25496 [translate_table: standard]
MSLRMMPSKCFRIALGVSTIEQRYVGLVDALPCLNAIPLECTGIPRYLMPGKSPLGMPRRCCKERSVTSLPLWTDFSFREKGYEGGIDSWMDKAFNNAFIDHIREIFLVIRVARSLEIGVVGDVDLALLLRFMDLDVMEEICEGKGHFNRDQEKRASIALPFSSRTSLGGMEVEAPTIKVLGGKLFWRFAKRLNRIVLPSANFEFLMNVLNFGLLKGQFLELKGFLRKRVVLPPLMVLNHLSFSCLPLLQEVLEFFLAKLLVEVLGCLPRYFGHFAKTTFRTLEPKLARLGTFGRMLGISLGLGCRKGKHTQVGIFEGTTGLGIEEKLKGDVPSMGALSFLPCYSSFPSSILEFVSLLGLDTKDFEEDRYV